MKLHPLQAIREVGRSFVYAFAGLLYTMHSQRNMRFHIFFAIFAMVFYVAFNVPFVERAILMIVICLVPAFEIINTSIESQMNYVANGKHILLKRAKDTAAAAVLVMALLSMAMGGYILLPGFIEHFQEPSTEPLWITGRRFIGAVIDVVRAPQHRISAPSGLKYFFAMMVILSLLLFWLLRSIRYLFNPLLALTTYIANVAAMALCIYGHDPSAYVAMTFLIVLEQNAFARLVYTIRVANGWGREDFPFDTAGFRIILPAAILGGITGGYLAWGPLSYLSY